MALPKRRLLVSYYHGIRGLLWSSEHVTSCYKYPSQDTSSSSSFFSFRFLYYKAYQLSGFRPLFGQMRPRSIIDWAPSRYLKLIQLLLPVKELKYIDRTTRTTRTAIFARPDQNSKDSQKDRLRGIDLNLKNPAHRPAKQVITSRQRTKNLQFLSHYSPPTRNQEPKNPKLGFSTNTVEG
jgi:hypothetical protein